jgi:hypothetical protein
VDRRDCRSADPSCHQFLYVIEHSGVGLSATVAARGSTSTTGFRIPIPAIASNSTATAAIAAANSSVSTTAATAYAAGSTTDRRSTSGSTSELEERSMGEYSLCSMYQLMIQNRRLFP